MRAGLPAIAFCFAAFVLADGGPVEFRKEAGSLLITVFGAPAILRVGAADLSVLVQNRDNSSAVLDAEVLLTLSKVGERKITLPATRDQATNKLLYAAYPVLPSSGEWRVNVQVKSQGHFVGVDGVITVIPGHTSVSTYWPYIALAPVGILLFVINQWLKSRSRNLRFTRTGSYPEY